MIKISSCKNILYLSISFVAFNLLFINKAFHIDDTFTISVTRSIERNFFRPEGFFSNPPFIGYYYLPVLKIFGERESIYHLFYLPFTVLAIISMFMLSKRFVRESLLPTLSLIVIPAFLVISQSIILDIPLLGFFLGALALFIYGVDRNDNRLLLLSGMCTAVAVLIKYSGLLLIPCMLAYALLFLKNRIKLMILLLPILVFLMWGFFCLFKYGYFPFIQAGLMRLDNISGETLFERLLACLSFISGSSLLVLFLAPIIAFKDNNRLMFLASLSAALLLISFPKDIFNAYSFLEKVFLFSFFSASIFIIFFKLKLLYLAMFKKDADKESVFLSLWFLFLLVFIIIIQSVSVRFVLLLFPPMFLFLYRQLERLRLFEYLNFKKITLSIISCVFAISVMVAIGDYHFAGTYRNLAARLKRKTSSNTKIYFPACFYTDFCTWGFSYYLGKYFPQRYFRIPNDLGKIYDQNNNALIILPVEPVLPVAVEICPLPELEDFGLTKMLVEKITYESFVFLHQRRYKTGFFSHDWGLFPFKILAKKEKLEEIDIYKIIPLDSKR